MSPSSVKTQQSVESLSIVDHLASISCFQSLSHIELDAVSTLFTLGHFAKESVIFYEQDSPAKTGSRLYFLIEGSVKLVKYSSDGESTIVRLASAGEFFGATSALTGRANPFSAETLSDTQVLQIKSNDFKALVTKHPQIALDMMCAMGEVLWFNYATHNQVVKKSESRVAKIILYHLDRDGAEQTDEGLQLKIQLPHDYIASMTGIAYEESVRIISRLKKQYSCITYLRGGKILITNLDALRTIGQDADGLTI